MASQAAEDNDSRALFGLTDRYDFDVSGQIVFEGEDILSADAKKRRKLYGSDIALIPQNPMTAFDPSCKIGNQLAETYRLHNKSSAKAARNAVLEAMQRAGLEDCKAVWSSYPYMLSGGMLQRAAVAAAIMNRPRLIIADEPTTALDAEHRIAVTDMLKSLCGSAAVINGNSRFCCGRPLRRACLYNEEWRFCGAGRYKENDLLSRK